MIYTDNSVKETLVIRFDTVVHQMSRNSLKVLFTQHDRHVQLVLTSKQCVQYLEKQDEVKANVGLLVMNFRHLSVEANQTTSFKFSLHN